MNFPTEEAIRRVAHSGVLLPGETLLIKANPSHNRQALLLGLDASIFVNSHRLRRDLSLWAFL